MTNASNNQSSRNDKIAGRIDAIGWALFFVMIGGLGLFSAESVPEGTWLVGLGVIWLGGNAARFAYGLKAIGWTLIAGVVALAAGLGGIFGVELPIFPILLVVCGLSVAASTLRRTSHAS